MASSFSQSPFFSPLIPINKKNISFSPQHIHLITFKVSSSKAETSLNSQENEPESQIPEQDPVKLAFAKAKSYKSSSIFNSPAENSAQNSLQDSIDARSNEGSISDIATKIDNVNKEVPFAARLAMEKEKEKEKGNEKSREVSEVIKDEGGGKELPLALKLALEKANEYRKNKGVEGKNETLTSEAKVLKNKEVVEVINDNGGEKELPLALRLALEKANEYKKNKGVVGVNEASVSGLKGGSARSSEDKKQLKDTGKKEELTISSMDFMGLGFADKKEGRSLPAGLVPISDPFLDGDLPEVEILVGDASKFGGSKLTSNPVPVEEDVEDLYKPKVTTWGLFPRPNDISKAYGGGRTLRPGEALETAEEKAAKQARTRQLLAAYKTKIGMNIDPKLKSYCEQALKDGDSRMDAGQLKEALPFYEEVMEKLPFQTEIHGLAALQWSICQDSLTRPNEARIMYEKLQSHPRPIVSKKARQLYFSFQAMEIMKVTSSPRSPLTGYQNYFDAFVKEKINFSLQDGDEENEALLSQTFPYFIFLAAPIFMVFLIAAFRSQ